MNLTSPKEKAAELVNKFLEVEDSRYGSATFLMLEAEAKECAIICCEEIINNPYNHQRDLTEDLHDEFWNSVIQEIKKI